jgi:hypothetical protein
MRRVRPVPDTSGGKATLGTMKCAPTFPIFVAVALVSGGCSRTYVSTGAPGIPSPDEDTRLCLTIHGAYGRAYTERTKKLLEVWIRRGPYTNAVTLFSHTYKFVGGDLTTDVQWASTNQVVMQVYDYGDRVLEDDARERRIPSNHITTLIFYRDEQTGKFEEKR